MKQIMFYGTKYCADCIRSKQVFDKWGIEYKYIDLETDDSAAGRVRELNNGYQSIPTILFPDETVLTEPSNLELTQKLAQFQDQKLISSSGKENN